MSKLTAFLAIEKLLSDYNFESVLDIGCGVGKHSEIFRNAGKRVTATDIADFYPDAVRGFYQDLKFEPHDVTWASHVLEHQLNVNQFLSKVRSETREGGYTCITVPPMKNSIVGGHVSLWNAGLLLYNLVLAGFDCKDARVKKYKYNITVIAQAKTFALPELHYDTGDIDRLKPWLPDFCQERFDGDIDEWNW